MTDQPETNWLLVDVSLTQTRVAVASPSAHPVVGSEQVYDNAAFTTLTDVLLRFEKDRSISLRDSRCGLSMPGATHGDSMSVARGRWTVSRVGLASVFGRPASIINEVAAVAWALLHGSSTLVPLGSFAKPDFTKPGCWAVVSMDAGVGLAAIVVDPQGRTNVLEGEGGHAGFSPADRVERQLLEHLQVGDGRVSWERVITLADDDPVWARVDPAPSMQQKADLHARFMGSFVGDVALTLGSWNGVIVTGRHTANLKSGTSQMVFNDRFQSKHLRRLMQSTPRWWLQRTDAAMLGIATMMAHRFAK